MAKDKPANIPDWVKQAVSQPKLVYPPRTNAVVLLRETEYSVDPAGVTVEHMREVVRVLRPQARREYGTVGTYFSNDMKLHYLKAWSIMPDGREFAVDPKDLTDRSVGAGFELYTDLRYRSAPMPGVDTGSIVATEYERVMRPYDTDITVHIDDDVPVVRQSVILSLPPGFTYKSVWKGEHRTRSIDLEHGRTRWDLENLPAINLEDTHQAPSFKALASRLDIHYSGPGLKYQTGGDWKGIGLWYGEIAQGRNVANDPIRTKAQALVQGKTDFADRLQAIAEYVQHDIRYVAVEIGIGGDQPHAAADIFSHSYGDCKDKATLLSAMLQAVGIRSTWVLVDTARGYISPEAPSTSGNHAIAAIEIPEGYSSPRFYSVVKAASGKRFLIFDPTWDMTPFGQLEMELQGGYGILVDGDQSEVIALPVLKPEQNLQRRTADLHLSATGELKGTVVTTQGGDVARSERELFTSGTLKEQNDYLSRQLAADLNGVRLSDVQVENASSLMKDIKVTYTVGAESYSRSMGSLIMLRPRVLGTDGFRLDKKPRDIAINLHRTRRVEDEYEIELPAGYTVDELPPAAKIDTGFASYESKTEMRDGKLRYKRAFEVREVTLPASKYDDLRKLAEVIETDEQNVAILKTK